MASGKYIAMIGTHHDTMGGVASVVSVYRRTGLFERRRVLYFSSHADGTVSTKLTLALTSWIDFIGNLARGRISLVHAHVSSRASFWRKSLFLIPSIWLRLPTILHLHGSEFRVFYEDECSPLQKRWVRYVFDNCSQVLVLSQDWHHWVCRITTNPHIDILFNPVQIPPQVQQRETTSDPTILSLGRLGHRKGSYDLLEAASILKQKGLSFRLRLGGDGELAEVADKAEKLGVHDRLDILGWVVGVEKETELSNASIFALPSYNEGLPMALLEAMAAGLPIVSTSVGGIPDAIRHGVEGFLLQPGDINSLATHLSTLLEEPSLRKRMGMNSHRRVVDTFSAEALMPKLEKIYDDVMTRGRPLKSGRSEERF